MDVESTQPIERIPTEVWRAAGIKLQTVPALATPSDGSITPSPGQLFRNPLTASRRIPSGIQ